MVMRGFIGQSSQCKQQVTHFSLGGSNGEASMVIESVEQFQKKSKTHSTGFRRPCVFAQLELDSV